MRFERQCRSTCSDAEPQLRSFARCCVVAWAALALACASHPPPATAIPDPKEDSSRGPVLRRRLQNVGRLAYTNQLRDYAAYAQQQGYTFQLAVGDPGAIIPRPGRGL
jgi:hypothetical protein